MKARDCNGRTLSQRSEPHGVRHERLGSSSRRGGPVICAAWISMTVWSCHFMSMKVCTLRLESDKEWRLTSAIPFPLFLSCICCSLPSYRSSFLAGERCQQQLAQDHRMCNADNAMYPMVVLGCEKISPQAGIHDMPGSLSVQHAL